MSLPVLETERVMDVENDLMARGTSLELLIDRAVRGCSDWITKNYPRVEFPAVGILAGSGHNGADALGIATHLLDEGRLVCAILSAGEDNLKPATRAALQAFNQKGGKTHFATSNDFSKSVAQQDSPWTVPSLWIDGLHGTGLNRSLANLSQALIKRVQAQNKPIVAIDIPSGLQGNLGHFQQQHSDCIHASETLALGCLKPVHVLDTCLEALGKVHLIPLGFEEIIAESSSATCFALTVEDLTDLLKSARRRPASHKFKNGRVLIVAGSEKYPGAAVMTCMGAGISGAGMVHALVPSEARQAILNHTPEVILERHLPELSSFDAVVMGPGWIPADEHMFNRIMQHVAEHENCFAVLDAGVFEVLEKEFGNGRKLNSRCLLTPHGGEFARLFPGISVDNRNGNINSIEAAKQAAFACNAIVLAKGARSCIAFPEGSADVILESTPLLAHAGQGDVLAGLLGGLLARMKDPKGATRLAALLQAQAALRFSKRCPAALTISPLELVQQIRMLDF